MVSVDALLFREEFTKEVMNKAWDFASEIIGKEHVQELKDGRSIFVLPRNGILYELKPNADIYNKNTNEYYCLQVNNVNGRLPLPDILATKYQYITQVPKVVEKKSNKFSR